MNILIVTAHPSSKGFTHKIAQVYKKAAEKAGNEVEILDLYKEENKQEYLEFENLRELKECPKREKMQAKISWAEELVLIFPLWWLGMPAVMKNFIDTNFSVRFAYKYVKAPIIKGRPLGLLKGKSARVFVTCDGANWMYKLVFTPYKLIIKYFIFALCGIKTKSFITFDRMRFSGESKKDKRLERVKRMASR